MDDRWHTSRNRDRAVFTSGLDGGLKLLLDRNRALGEGSHPELGMEIWIGRLKLCTTEGREVSPGFGVGCCSSLPEWPLESVGRRKREHRVRNRYRRPSQNRYQFLVRVWWEERWVERWGIVYVTVGRRPGVPGAGVMVRGSWCGVAYEGDMDVPVPRGCREGRLAGGRKEARGGKKW